MSNNKQKNKEEEENKSKWKEACVMEVDHSDGFRGNGDGGWGLVGRDVVVNYSLKLFFLVFLFRVSSVNFS